MPAKSKKQARMIGYLYSQGKVSKKTLHEFNSGVDYDSLPTRKKKKKKRTY